MKIIEGKELGKWLNLSLGKADANRLWVASPYITKAGLEPIKEWIEGATKKKKSLKLLTRLDMMAIAAGALDIEALIELLKVGKRSVEIYDIEGLHAKVYIVNGEAVVGSGNATQSGIGGANIELGIHITETEFKEEFSQIKKRFSDWLSSGQSINRDDLEKWKKMYEDHYARRLTYINPNQLQIFPSEMQNDYFQHMCDALKKISKKPCKLKNAYELFENKEQGQEGSHTPENRMRFLEFLSLLRVGKEQVSITQDARRLLDLLKASKVEASDSMLELLKNKIPAFHVVYEWLNDRDGLKDYEDLDKAEGHLAHYESLDRHNTIRWMISLDVIEVEQDGHKKCFQLKRKYKK